MKNAWPLTQILLLSSIAIAIVAVVVTIIMTNTTLRSVEKNQCCNAPVDLCL